MKKKLLWIVVFAMSPIVVLGALYQIAHTWFCIGRDEVESLDE